MKYSILLVCFTSILAACSPIPPASVNNQPSSPDNSTSMVASPTVTTSNSENQANTRYVDYTPTVAMKSARQGQTVLFFHAKWCPTCRAAESDIKNNLDQIPSNLTILKVDYDAESALKEKYNIVTQHTFVIIDPSGNELAKWNGGELSEILDQVSRLPG